MIKFLLNSCDASGVFTLDYVCESSGRSDEFFINDLSAFDNIYGNAGINVSDHVEIYGNRGVDFYDVRDREDRKASCRGLR